uniref:U41-Liphistoxin-Lsp1a_1 n=2 Tax=Liphistius TaxID=62150 RepID=A0A4Q8K5V8_9ARAC
MNRIVGACFLLIICVVGCFALDCPGCDLSRCPSLDPSTCRLGSTKDACACCPVCYKTIGEECGGPWNVKGLCGGHLTCVKPPSPSGEFDPVHEFNSAGTCLALP